MTSITRAKAALMIAKLIKEKEDEVNQAAGATVYESTPMQIVNKAHEWLRNHGEPVATSEIEETLAMWIKDKWR